MKWIELIQVRASPTAFPEFLPQLTKELQKLGKVRAMAETFLMQHGLFDGDMAIVLVWDHERKPMKTREGLLVAGLMQQWGQTTHAVWMPLNDDLGQSYGLRE